MSVPRFFASRLAVGTVELAADEARHAARVMRLGRGDPVRLFDGEGGQSDAVVTVARRDRVEVEILRTCRQARPQRCALTLAVAPPKGQRQNVLVEKCTELGVDALRPLLTGRGVARAGPQTVERWRRWALEACKQCGRLWLPRVLDAAGFSDVAGGEQPNALALITHPGAGAAPLDERVRGLPAAAAVVLHVGPEGGWTEDELAAAAGAGMQAVRISDAILRTETAAIAATAIFRAATAAGE